MDGPKVVILEQIRQQAKDICRIGTCYLDVVPPSSHVYFNDSYDLSDLDVSEHKFSCMSIEITFIKDYFLYRR